MSIGKNSILRVQNAEKNGAAQIITEAPDMENSTVIEEPKKKAAPKKTSKKPAPKKSAPKKAAPQKGAACLIRYFTSGGNRPGSYPCGSWLPAAGLPRAA